MTDSKGRWVWHEVMSTDVAKGRGYYQEMFNWAGQEMDMGPAGTYVVFKAGDAMVAGMAGAQGGAPSHWLSYLDVGDLDAAVARVPDLGGEVVSPPAPLPMGRFAIVKDPDGAMLGFFESGEGGEERDWSAPPAPFSVCWTEHMAKDPAKVEKFYTELVGWTSEPMGPDMIVFKAGDAKVSTVRKMPEEAKGAPAHWMNYVLVPEVDDFQAKSERLGATTLKGDTEIPGMGRFAILQDPAGAVYAIWKDLSQAQ